MQTIPLLMVRRDWCLSNLMSFTIHYVHMLSLIIEKNITRVITAALYFCLISDSPFFKRYVLTDEHPCCIPCYEQNFTHTCRVCERRIGLDSKDMSYKDLHWHEDCFKCRRCKTSLVEKPFAAKNALIFCAGCYDAEFASRCDACGDTFRPGKLYFSYYDICNYTYNSYMITCIENIRVLIVCF